MSKLLAKLSLCQPRDRQHKLSQDIPGGLAPTD